MNGWKRIASLGVIMLCASHLFGAGLDQVQKKILDNASVEDLRLQVQDDVVTLEGQASILKDKQKAEEIVTEDLKLPVVNKITLPQTMKTDEDIKLEIAARFRKKASGNYAFNSVFVQAKDGHVVLTGQVRDAYFADRAEEAALEVIGVRSVENRVEILNVSAFDEQLRGTIYRRLSRDGLLSNYFLGARPSIHIIVSQSRVTLVGAVNSNVDRVRAASRIRELSGVLSVDNQLEVVRGV